MFRSATFKLTMWYLAIVMAISILFSVILYHVATAELARGLHRETMRIYTQFPVFQGSPFLKPGSELHDSAHRILLRLIGLNLILLASAGLASYLLARRTLSPIEVAHEQQKRFTADVSHELRTPLTALRMESEVALLNDKTSAKELRSTLSSNLEEVSKLEALINNLLRLTRLEEAELRHNFTTISSEEVIAKALQQVSKHAQSRHITIDVQTAQFELFGDEASLVQLIVLLLDNAIKYSHEQTAVQLTTAERGTHGVDFVISDKGIGIEAEALDHIFERFYRADSSRNKTKTEGYGLGLSIAKMIADLHHGSITLASLPNVGTTATIHLPPKPKSEPAPTV